MCLKKSVYSTLIVSASANFNTALYGLLPESKCSPAHTCSSISAAKRVFAEQEFDFVLINSPLPDDTGVRFAIDVCKSKNCVALLLVRSELHDEIYEKVFPWGVFTLAKPTSRTALIRALDWMVSTRERLRNLEKKALSIEEKMEEIRLVNHAKWLLISQRQMNESAAHRYIEKQAMNRCLTQREVSLEIIQNGS